ncbi:hypothetical protein CR513_33396, partial [Mucuna pruriens]
MWQRVVLKPLSPSEVQQDQKKMNVKRESERKIESKMRKKKERVMPKEKSVKQAMERFGHDIHGTQTSSLHIPRTTICPKDACALRLNRVDLNRDDPAWSRLSADRRYRGGLSLSQT